MSHVFLNDNNCSKFSHGEANIKGERQRVVKWLWRLRMYPSATHHCASNGCIGGDKSTHMIGKGHLKSRSSSIIFGFVWNSCMVLTENIELFGTVTHLYQTQVCGEGDGTVFTLESHWMCEVSNADVWIARHATLMGNEFRSQLLSKFNDTLGPDGTYEQHTCFVWLLSLVQYEMVWGDSE